MAEHKDLAAGRWKTLTFAEQMGNIGSEVERAIRAHTAGRTDRFEPALRRALELFDLTAATTAGMDRAGVRSLAHAGSSSVCSSPILPPDVLNG